MEASSAKRETKWLFCTYQRCESGVRKPYIKHTQHLQATKCCDVRRAFVTQIWPVDMQFYQIWHTAERTKRLSIMHMQRLEHAQDKAKGEQERAYIIVDFEPISP